MSLVLLITNTEERKRLFKAAINKLGQGNNGLKVITDIDDLITTLKKDVSCPVCIDWNLGDKSCALRYCEPLHLNPHTHSSALYFYR